MIPLPGIRDKGGGLQLGAKGPHQRGPFGRWPDPDGLDEDDDQDDGEKLPDTGRLSGSRNNPSDHDQDDDLDEDQLLDDDHDQDDEQHVTAIRREWRRTEHRYGYA